MTDPELVAQILSERIPVKTWDGAWAIWDCPCGKNEAEDRGTLAKLPVKQQCFQCGKSYIIYDPEQDND